MSVIVVVVHPTISSSSSVVRIRSTAIVRVGSPTASVWSKKNVVNRLDLRSSTILPIEIGVVVVSTASSSEILQPVSTGGIAAESTNGIVVQISSCSRTKRSS